MEQQVNIFSKEAIRARMMQNATSLWGLKNAQSLDPFVRLLIEAFSTEIFKVSNEVNNIKARMLEKMARLLTPTIYTIPQPAHAVGFAYPIESQIILYGDTEFFYQRKFPSSIKTVGDVTVEMPFTPIDNIRLVKAKITGLFMGNTCYTFDEKMNKIPLATIVNGGLPYATVLLAIELDDDFDERIDELSIYCLCPNFEHEEWVYSLLPYASFTINGHSLSVKAGLQYVSDETATGYNEIFNEYTSYKKIKDTVKHIYTDHFITLTGFPLNTASLITVVPNELTAFGPHAQGLAKPGKKYMWLHIKLPPQYDVAVLDNFSFILNAFPVINRKWKQNQCKFDAAGNNIPLVTVAGEHFLMIDEVADAAGRKYEEIPYSQVTSINKGLYSIRVSGMERFDERNAIDLINYVLELTRDEVAAYGNIERDTVIDSLREMVKQMKFLAHKLSVSEGMIKQVPSYVIAEPHQENEYMFASYWVTTCTMANNLKAGLTMDNHKISNLQKGIITLLTNTMGGSEAQRGGDAVQAYRYALTTRDRIITTEDIKNFCKMELGNLAQTINVTKGTVISPRPKEGFIRTIEIVIISNDYDQFKESFWLGKAKSLKQQISLRAVDGMEYRVFFNPDPLLVKSKKLL